jgi:predicted DsbA family dithiol-disulfide isomerase
VRSYSDRMAPLTVDIWSDVVCPWCYIGKRRFEAALARFDHRDEVEVTWHSFELDPEAPAVPEGTTAEHLAAKYGMSVDEAAGRQDEVAQLAAQEGLEYDLAGARRGNTFDAHRLIHLGAQHGIQDAVKERLMRAYFTEREAIGDTEALGRIAVDAGLPADEVAELLAGDRFAQEVRVDEDTATRLGIRGVPYFVLGRRYGLSGAQPADIILQALQQAWDEAHSAAA